MTREETLYDLMARILACASKHQACADDPEFQMLSMEACDIPPPAKPPRVFRGNGGPCLGCGKYLPEHLTGYNFCPGLPEDDRGVLRRTPEQTK